MVHSRRDNFSPAVAGKARDLVSAICSNPDCRVFTVSGQVSGTGDTTNVGTAAHIHAAAPGGPRYEPTQTREERRGIANAIWLCATCARLIDSDVAAYPADLLRKWRADAEQTARTWIGKRATTFEARDAEDRSEVGRQLDAIVRHVGALGPTLQTAFVRRLDLRPPPLVTSAIPREATVAQMLAAVGERRWLAIHGDVAIGKTHLAALLARARGESIWIRMRGVDVPEAAARVESAVALRAGDFPQTVVVDDMPGVRDELLEALLRLLGILSAPTLLISTSNHSLGLRIREYVPADRLLEAVCPRLTDDEAAELVRAHGANNLSSKAVAFLNALAHQHPALLTAVCRHLAARNWVWDHDAVGSLFARAHLPDVNGDTIRALRESVASETARSLLYRLTLVRGSFDEELAAQLADVPPTLPLVHERLADLDGLWIQRQNDDRYAASPLVTSLPPAVVDQSVRLECYRILAARAMRGPVTPGALVDATLYHAQAGEFDLAAQTLSFGLISFAFEERRVSPGDMLLFWWDVALPSEMSPDAAVSLRCAQIAAGHRAGKDISALASDLATRLSNPALSWGVVAGAGVAFKPLMATHSPTALSLVRRALTAFDGARLPSGQLLSTVSPLRIESLAWLVAPELRTHEQVLDWLAFVLELPPTAFDEEQGWKVGREACVMVIDGLWLHEAQKPSDERSWPAVESLLSSIRASALSKRNLMLAALATRARMVVLAEYMDRAADAIALARETLPAVRGDAYATYLVQECEGRQALYRGELETALTTLDAALGGIADDLEGGLEVLHTLNSAARAAWRASPADAVTYARRAKRVATALGKAGELEVARVCGELAIACEHADDSRGAYAALAEGADALLASSRASDSWRHTAAIFAHTAGYIGRFMTTGQPPPSLPGGEAYARPEQGVFYVASSDVQRVLRPQAMASVCVMLAEFAARLEVHDDALRWGTRTLEEADADPSGEAPQFIALALPHMTPGAVRDPSLLADAIVAAVNASRTRVSQSDMLVLVLSIIPLAGEILLLSVNRDAARPACEQAARLCTDVSGRLGGSPTFDAASSVFRTAASTDGAVHDLILLANRLATSGMEGAHLVAALLASVDERRGLAAVAQAHLAVLPVLEGPNLAHVRARIMGNLERYWRAMFAAAPFQFSHPSALRETLAAVTEGSPLDRASRVVRAVADDLRVRR